MISFFSIDLRPNKNFRVFFLIYHFIYNIKIVVADDCTMQNMINCATNPYRSVTVIYSWIFQVTAGYNILNLANSVSVNKGFMILLNQNTAKIAIDVSGTAVYSDLALVQNIVWSPVNANSNWRFFLNTLDDFIAYGFTLNFVHTYSDSSLFNMSFMYTNPNGQIQQQIINVTQGENKF